ncbi:hypothetical protein ACHAW6_009880 [Cyclotella cf. meneghiniana]
MKLTYISQVVVLSFLAFTAASSVADGDGNVKKISFPDDSEDVDIPDVMNGSPEEDIETSRYQDDYDGTYRRYNRRNNRRSNRRDDRRQKARYAYRCYNQYCGYFDVEQYPEETFDAAVFKEGPGKLSAEKSLLRK